MVSYLDNNSGFNSWNAMQQQKQQKKSSSGFFKWMLIFLLAWWVFGSFFESKNVPVEPQNTVIVENSTVEPSKIDAQKISFDVQGLRVANIALKEHLQDVKSTENVSLLSAENNFIEIGFLSADTQTPNINTQWKMNNNNMVWNNKDKISFTRDIVIDDYVIKISDTVKNNSKKK